MTQPFRKTKDPISRLANVIRKLAKQIDEISSSEGLSTRVMYGNVIEDYPDIKVSIEGTPNLTDEAFYLSANAGDLVIADHLRLAVGDRIAMLPTDSSNKWNVFMKVRSPNTQPTDRAKIGYNGDRTGGAFSGVEVVYDPVAGTSTIIIKGDNVEINGTHVFIKGVEV